MSIIPALICLVVAVAVTAATVRPAHKLTPQPVAQRRRRLSWRR